jgi:DNA-binding transcriptional ArsR family regulator
MAAKTRERNGNEPELVRVAAHRLRIRALAIFSERAASPKELAAELDTPVGNISYHVRELEQLGMIELVEEKQRRGAVEHFYRAVHRPLLRGEDWNRLGPEKRRQISTWVFHLILADAAQALEAGTFDSRDDRHMTHVQLTLDQQGWRELVDIQENALAATLAVRAASAERLSAAGEDGFPVTATASCFEMPPRPAAAGSSD